MGEFMGVLIDFEDRIAGIYDDRCESELIIDRKKNDKLEKVEESNIKRGFNDYEID